ncbi:hypothetical protein HYFRA_00010406 [Hymenoscyphus fraxineus]|uniref:Uncharacterized protein n=1 Tax=Hymenoscyphus fraxineus TaxID=746836 RepID=A0A9N9L4F8_9HELO|nr:hypothetical protein HYFRA_00010406 [Hymenoscyphus fraxineus]
MSNRWSRRWTPSLARHNNDSQKYGNSSAPSSSCPDEESSEGENHGSAFRMISKLSKRQNSTQSQPPVGRRASIKEVATHLFTRRQSVNGGSPMQMQEVQVGNNNHQTRIVGLDVIVGTKSDDAPPPPPPRKNSPPAEVSRDRTRVRPLQRQSQPPPTTRTRGASISSITKGISETLTRTVSVTSPPRTLRRRDGPIVIPPPDGARSESVSTPEKGGKTHDRHDSSYSSVSSSFELHRDGSKSSRISRVIIPPTSPTLTTSQLTDLKAFLSDVETLLMEQHKFCESFSHNLLFLMAIKERVIRDNKRLNLEWKKGLTRELSACREELGRVFTRKAVVGERSMAIVRDLVAKLDEENKKEGDMMSRKRGSLLEPFRGRAAIRSRPPLTRQTPPSPPQKDPNELTLEVVNKALTSLRKDVGLQKLLDDCILDAVTRKCWKPRWCRNHSMKIEMKRFVGFVSERCERLARKEADLKILIAGMEDAIDDGNGKRSKRTSGVSAKGVSTKGARNSWTP